MIIWAWFSTCLDMTVLRFSENDGNRQSGETGQLAKPAQPLSISLCLFL
jgi:hypothetical protein